MAWSALLACSSAQLGPGTFPSGYLIPLSIFPSDTGISTLVQFYRKMIGNKAGFAKTVLSTCILMKMAFIEIEARLTGKSCETETSGTQVSRDLVVPGPKQRYLVVRDLNGGT